MDKIEAVINRLPKFYNTDTTSRLYKLLKAITDEYDVASVDYISRADSDIGVDTTIGDDLDWRWGSLLNVARQSGESDVTYRKRLMSITNALHGGTADSIHYAVAIFLGLADDEVKADRCIKVYDGWKYENADIDMKAFGHIVCVFSLESEDRDVYYNGIEADIISKINDAKAAGTIAHVVVEFTRYDVVSKYTHEQLSAFTHDQIRKWGIS